MNKSHWFCDWLTCRVCVNHDDGFFGGKILWLGPQGEWLRCKDTWNMVEREGSSCSKVAVRSLEFSDIMEPYLCGVKQEIALQRCVMRYGSDLYGNNSKFTMLEISGNPTKYLQGHNVWGSDDIKRVLPMYLRDVIRATGVKMTDAELKRVDLLDVYLSRFDLTSNIDLKNARNKGAFLMSLRNQATGKWCGRKVHKETAMFGKKGRFQLRFYDKSTELLAHFPRTPKIDHSLLCGRGGDLVAKQYKQKMVDYCKLTTFLTSNIPDLLGYVRFEMEIGSQFMSDNGITKVCRLLNFIEKQGGAQKWSLSRLDNIRAGVMDMDHYQVTVYRVKLREFVDMGDAPNSVLVAYDLWASGQNPRDSFARATYYRLLKVIKTLVGIDIGCPLSLSETDKDAQTVRGAVIGGFCCPSKLYAAGIVNPPCNDDVRMVAPNA